MKRVFGKRADVLALVLSVLAIPTLSRASPMTFDVSGITTNETAGSLGSCASLATTPTGWELSSVNSSSDILVLLFDTSPIPESLVGFTGGTVFAGSVDLFDTIAPPLYGDVSGNIASAATVTEPSSILLLASAPGSAWIRIKDAKVPTSANRVNHFPDRTA